MTGTHIFLVTVKLPKRNDYDPHNKVTDQCPATEHSLHYICTDVTGEHHTVILETDNRMTASEVLMYLKEHDDRHIMRVEGPVTREHLRLNSV